jgi:hypothetical protein
VGCLVAQGVRFVVGPQDPKDVTRDTARDLSGLAGELAALKADAHHWLDGTEYTTLKHRLEDAHAAALVLEVCDAAGILTRAHLVASGYHRHNGEWRRARV